MSTKKTCIGLATIIVTLAILLGFGAKSVSKEVEQPVVEAVEVKPELTHAQKVWLGALEWCESRGKPSAVNEMDLDGTASYYSFQFKPSTFKSLSILYKILPPDLEEEDYWNYMSMHEYQYKVVTAMVLDPSTRWEQQFPGCVRLLGRPPKY